MSLKVEIAEMESWIEVMRGDTLVIRLTSGEAVHCCSSRAGYAAALTDRQIAFSPLEILEVLNGASKGGALEAVRWKKCFTGARVTDNLGAGAFTP